MNIPDSRANFNNTWLTESPEGIEPIGSAPSVERHIREWVAAGIPVVHIDNTLKKLEGNQVVYYWYEVKNKILLGIEFEKKPQALVVRLIGKTNKGQPPYASDLYNAVLADRKNMPGEINSIRILSDKQLSDEGLGIWKKLLQLGHKVSVYDKNNPGATFTEILSQEQLMQYFKHDDSNYAQYQYVLSESGLAHCETNSHFGIRRHRELAGMKLD